MSRRRTFFDLCLTGEALTEDMDDYIDAWHAAPEGKELHDFLGLKEDEYSLWLRAPDALPCILQARRDGKPLTKAVKEAYEAMRLAPPANNSLTVARLQKWLREKDVTA